jgi:hypothetical protein
VSRIARLGNQIGPRPTAALKTFAWRRPQGNSAVVTDSPQSPRTHSNDSVRSKLQRRPRSGEASAQAPRSGAVRVYGPMDTINPSHGYCTQKGSA